MLAIKAARAYTDRPMIAKCEGAYHGAYDPVEVSLSSTPENWGEPDAPARVRYTRGLPEKVMDDVVGVSSSDHTVSPSGNEAPSTGVAETGPCRSRFPLNS